MYESGYYPAGAEYDPCAPWNERERVMVTCEACGGTGFIYHAYDFDAVRETECSHEEYEQLPDSEEEAIERNMSCVKGHVDSCTFCDGEGVVENELDYDDYDDD